MMKSIYFSLAMLLFLTPGSVYATTSSETVVGEVISVKYDSRGEYSIVEVQTEISKNSLDKVVILKKINKDREQLTKIMEGNLGSFSIKNP